LPKAIKGEPVSGGFAIPRQSSGTCFAWHGIIRRATTVAQDQVYRPSDPASSVDGRARTLCKTEPSTPLPKSHFPPPPFATDLAKAGGVQNGTNKFDRA
jgi:hypothetical protein